MEGVVHDLDREALVALVLELRRELAELRQVNAELRQENADLKRRVEEFEGQGAGPTKRLPESYSMKAEERRREQAKQASDAAAGTPKPPPGAGSTKERQKSQRRGRVATNIKVDQAEVIEVLLPEGWTLEQCAWQRTQPVCRIRQGRAVRVAYEIWQGPNGELPEIDGVRPLSEFGQEIAIGVAYLSYIVGLSLDKVCALMKFFWQLNLSKSQADALLHQLADEWETEFEALCQLLALSAVVHADETRWSINSVWALLSEQARLLIFGCHKDAATLEPLLPKKTFTGVLCTDDAAVYRDFSTAQKCWAHLLRKAIKFTLLDPENTTYKRVLDELLDIYHTAKQHSLNDQLTAAERGVHIETLTRRLCALCSEFVTDEEAHAVGTTAREFGNLMSELTRLSMAHELFTFVLHPAATGTNNEAERTLRQPAQDRHTGRTSKTSRGTRRRTVLNSVLESLRCHLPKFHLESVLAEIGNWTKTGQSLFTRLLKSTGRSPPKTPKTSILDQLYPKPAPS